MTERLDVVAVGHALVDVLSPTTDEFIDAQGLAKGGMALIDAARAADLYRQMGPATEMSGGSAANTAAGLANNNVGFLQGSLFTGDAVVNILAARMDFNW